MHTLSCLCCGEATRGERPAEMPTGQFGFRLQALIGMLSGRYHLSRRDIQEMLGTIFQVEMSLGSVSNQEGLVSAALKQPVQETYKYVRQHQGLVNVDETSWRQENQRCWLWTATTSLVTVFLLRGTRGSVAAQDLLGQTFEGIAGSDRWSGYNWLEIEQRQLCWAHLLRDFQAFVDRKGESAVIGELLLQQATKMFDLWYRVRDGTLTKAQFQEQLIPVRTQIEALLELGTLVDHSTTNKTCQNILKVAPALWTFVDCPDVEPTNNAAGRAVLWRKISYGSQSERGLRFTERILTVVTTLQQQGRSVWQYLTEVCRAHQLGLSIPSLLPNAHTT